MVSSTRLIVNYARASQVLKEPRYIDYALHGLNYLESVHWQAQTRSYAWTLQDHQPLDMTQQAYGYAFVLLAYAAVHKAGVADRAAKMSETYELLQQRLQVFLG